MKTLKSQKQKKPLLNGGGICQKSFKDLRSKFRHKEKRFFSLSALKSFHYSIICQALRFVKIFSKNFAENFLFLPFLPTKRKRKSKMDFLISSSLEEANSFYPLPPPPPFPRVILEGWQKKRNLRS